MLALRPSSPLPPSPYNPRQQPHTHSAHTRPRGSVYNPTSAKRSRPTVDFDPDESLLPPKRLRFSRRSLPRACSHSFPSEPATAHATATPLEGLVPSLYCTDIHLKGTPRAASTVSSAATIVPSPPRSLGLPTLVKETTATAIASSRTKNMDARHPDVTMSPERLDQPLPAPTLLPPSSSSVASSATTGTSSTAMLPHETSDDSASPLSFIPVPSLKRPTPKRLSLTLTMPSSSSSSTSDSSTPSDPVSATPTMFTSQASAVSTPYTPGPPRTPALAMTASLGRATSKRRPSLLSLVTQTSAEQMPPTPGGGFHYAAPSRSRIRAWSGTAAEASSHYACDPSGDKHHRSAHPSYRTFPPIRENDPTSPTFGMSYQSAGSSSPDTSPRTSSESAGSASTPSSSPPLPATTPFTTTMTPVSYPSRLAEPYENGPVEIIPNVFLGAEDSASDLTWTIGRFKRIRIVNVAQEIENPFGSSTSRGMEGKEKISFGTYAERDGYPEIKYCHLRWSHGESGLAQLPPGSDLAELSEGSAPDMDAESWGMWNAVKWLEEARRAGTPVLIHCQCGISRSATLVIAYLMSLAVAGLAPAHLSHLKGMQDTYDLVKSKSPCIGPNVSLVFQLVEYQRALTALLSDYVAVPGRTPPETSFPTLAEQSLSEAEWTKKRAEMDEEGGSGELDQEITRGLGLLASPLSPEEAGDEARMLDEAMRLRLRTRE